MAETMRAVDIKNTTGPAISLYINASTPKPTPRPLDALIKIKCFGLNRMDLLQREGHYPVPPQGGKTLGVEFSGIIASLGSQALTETEEGREWRVGDEVFGLAYGGAYAEFIAVSVKMLVRKPKELSWEVCAGVPETWITALQAMYLVGGFEKGKRILWHAGASSVSIAGVQLSREGGAEGVYVTAGSEEKINFCVKELGASKGWNYHTDDWVAGIKAETGGKGVDVIVDYIGRDYFQGNLDVAARDGRIVSLAFMSGSKLPEGSDISPFLFKRLRWEGSSLRSRDEDYQGRLRDMLVERAVPKMVSGEFKVHIEKVFPWEEVVQAHQLMESNRSKGKIICRID